MLRFNKERKQWDIIPAKEKQKGDFYLDGKEKKCLDHFKKQQQNNNDTLIPIVGPEGSGKGAKMGHILRYISDDKFDPKKDLIGADYVDGLTKIKNVKKMGWLGFDEFVSFGLGSETMKKEARDLHKIFSIFRQKNLFVVICLPSFFRLQSYYALDRSDALFSTYIKNGKRGFFSFYGKKTKDKLYRFGKKTHNMEAVKPTFRGRFTKCDLMETEDYFSFKESTLDLEIDKAMNNNKKPKTEWEIKKQMELDMVGKNMKTPAIELSKLFGMTERRIYQLKKQIREEISLK